MKEPEKQPSAIWWKAPLRQWNLLLQDREEQVFLVLTLVIGALVGAVVVAFTLRTTLPRGRRRLAAAVGSCGGLPGDGLSAVPLFSGSSREWCSSDKGCPVCPGRPHHVGHGSWEILLHLSHVGKWGARALRFKWARDWHPYWVESRGCAPRR